MHYTNLKNTIFDVEVSAFKDCFGTDSNPVNLALWLTSNKYEIKQNEIRSISNKVDRDKIKKQLPAITPSALLLNRDKKLTDAEKLISYSGFMQIDIDFKDNVHLSDYNVLMTTLPLIQNIAYCGRSVSGTGYFCLVPISNPEKLHNHFKKFNELIYTYYNIKLDTSKGSNITDLRIYSYSADAYFNINAIQFNQLWKPKIVINKNTAYKPFSSHYTNDKFSIVLERHNQKQIDNNQIGYTKGNQNNYLKSLASYCSIKGIDINETITGCHQFINQDYTAKRIDEIINSVYNVCKVDFNSKPFKETEYKSDTIKKIVKTKPLYLDPQRYKYLKTINLNIVLFEKKESTESVKSAKECIDNFYLTPKQVNEVWNNEIEFY